MIGWKTAFGSSRYNLALSLHRFRHHALAVRGTPCITYSYRVVCCACRNRTVTEEDLVPVTPSGRPPLAATSIAVGSFGIDAFPASNNRPAPDQITANTALEGYVDMDSDLVAPFTIPVEAMLTARVSNLVVPVGLSASHVAFSAIRLEPTWMSLGAAAGILAGMALRGGVSAGGSAWGNPQDVSLLALQNTTVAYGLPPVLYNDLANTTLECTAALLLLGPHGAANDATFSQAPARPLTRARGAHWLAGALRAVNATASSGVPPVGPVPKGALWSDYGPGRLFFPEAVTLAAAGDIIPAPSSATAFRPDDALAAEEWATWLRLSFSPHGETRVGNAVNDRMSPGAQPGHTAALTVCQAAEGLAAALLASLRV